MYVVTHWDHNANIEWVDPERVIEGGDEEEYFKVRLAPSDENEFIVFEACKMELEARLRARAREYVAAADRVANLTESQVRQKAERLHKPHSEMQYSKIDADAIRRKMPAGMDFASHPDDHAAAADYTDPDGEPL